jgi:hypothetical protein
VVEARGQFGNSEERERPPLEAVAKKLKTITEDTSVRACAREYMRYRGKVNPMIN